MVVNSIIEVLLSLFKYLKFLITSNNQHGVHSPFVYNFITRSIYAKSSYKSNKVFDVLLKSITYFDAKVILLPNGGDRILKNIIRQNSPKTVFQGKPYDVIYLEHPDKMSFEKFSPQANMVHNDSMLLINAIHKNKRTETRWENIKNWEHVTVTLDFFYCGAVFFRKQQAEEHFKIRI